VTGNSGEVEADDSLGACRTYRAAVTDLRASALCGTGVSPEFHDPTTGETPVLQSASQAQHIAVENNVLSIQWCFLLHFFARAFHEFADAPL